MYHEPMISGARRRPEGDKSRISLARRPCSNAHPSRSPPVHEGRRGSLASAPATWLAASGSACGTRGMNAGLTQKALAETVGLSQPEIQPPRARRWADAGLTRGPPARRRSASSSRLLRAGARRRRPRDSSTCAGRTSSSPSHEGRLARGARGAPCRWMVATRGASTCCCARRARHEAAVVEVWDLLSTAAPRCGGLEAKVRATRERLGAGWRVQGCARRPWNARNRGSRELRALFGARFPAPSTAWLPRSTIRDTDARRGWPRLDRRQGHSLDRRAPAGVTPAPGPLRMQHSGSCSPRPSTPSGSDPA